MAAALVAIPVLDGNGLLLQHALFWSSDGTATGNLVPAGVTLDQNFAPLDYTNGTPVVNGATPLVVTANSLNSPVLTSTYCTSIVGLVPPASATDFWGLIGGATNKAVSLVSLIITATATAAQLLDVSLVRRTTLNTGGTATHPTGTPTDNGYAAASATTNAYTANASPLGTAANASFPNAISKKLFVGTSALAPVPLQMCSSDAALGGVFTIYTNTEGLYLNLNAGTPGGGFSMDVTAIWTEK